MFEQGPRFLMISNSYYMKNANQQLGVTDVYRLPTRVGSYRLGGVLSMCELRQDYSTKVGGNFEGNHRLG